MNRPQLVAVYYLLAACGGLVGGVLAALAGGGLLVLALVAALALGGSICGAAYAFIPECGTCGRRTPHHRACPFRGVGRRPRPPVDTPPSLISERKP